MERRYDVTLKRGVDGEQFNQEMIAFTGDGYIPNRNADTAEDFKNLNRIWAYMLTDEEATNLRNDPRVVDVSIPAKEVPGVEVKPVARSIHDFGRSSFHEWGYYNWGLYRCNSRDDPFLGSTSTREGYYNYVLDGTGVDVVIMDGGIIAGHPDFADADGNSRVRQIDWFAESGVAGTMPPDFYTPYEGHGSHCAGIAAGLTQGWARNADIYDMHINLGADESGVEPDVGFDLILGWHNNKTNGRPTVINMSWGTSYALERNTYDIYLTNYRGNTSEVLINDAENGTSNADRLQHWSDYGVVATLGLIFYGDSPSADGSSQLRSTYLPFQNSVYDTGVQELIDAGCIVSIASGNDSGKLDVPGGDDYDNLCELANPGSVNRYSNQIYYHRPSSPYDDEAISVGNIDVGYEAGFEVLSLSSNRGPAVEIHAPGSYIVSAYHEGEDVGGGDNFFRNPLLGYYWGNISGTSMAAPQVAGIMALYAQLNPTWNMAQMKQAILADSTTGKLYDTGLNNDYNVRNNPTLLASPDRIAFNKFGVATDGKMQNGLVLRNSVLSQKK